MWGWTSDGSEPFSKRSLDAREDDPFAEVVPDESFVVNEEDIDTSNVTDPINCHELGTYDGDIPDLRCDYMGTDYETYLKELNEPFISDGGCTLS